MSYTLQQLQQMGAKPVQDNGFPKQEPTAVKQSFMKRMGSALIDPLKGGVHNTATIAKNVGQSFKDAGKNTVNNLSDVMVGKKSAAGAGFQAVGDVSKAVLSPINETVNTAVKDISDKASNIKGVQNFANSKAGNQITKATETPTEIYQKWTEKHPEAAKNLEALGNIGQLGLTIALSTRGKSGTQDVIKQSREAINNLPDSPEKPLILERFEKAVKAGNTDDLQAISKALTGTREAADATLMDKEPTVKNIVKNTGSGYKNMATDIFDKTLGKSALERDTLNIESKATKNALDIVKPKLTPTEEAAAKAQGRGSTKGILKKIVEIKPSAREIEMGNVAKEAGVKSSNTFDDNIMKMKEYQKTSAQKVRLGLKNSDAIWNKNELKGVLNKIEKPISLTQPDLPIANKLKSGILKLVDKAVKSPDGILDVRQQFDDLIEKNFGKKIFAKDDPKGILIRNYRQALNKFAESKIPDGELSDGSTVTAELRKQTLLYDAIDNVAAKAPKEGESANPIVQKIKTFAKKHPIVTGAAGALSGERILKNLGLPLP